MGIQRSTTEIRELEVQYRVKEKNQRMGTQLNTRIEQVGNSHRKLVVEKELQIRL
jgi:hypothetical protein